MPCLPCTCQPGHADPVPIGANGRHGCGLCGGECAPADVACPSCEGTGEGQYGPGGCSFCDASGVISESESTSVTETMAWLAARLSPQSKGLEHV